MPSAATGSGRWGNGGGTGACWWRLAQPCARTPGMPGIAHAKWPCQDRHGLRRCHRLTNPSCWRWPCAAARLSVYGLEVKETQGAIGGGRGEVVVVAAAVAFEQVRTLLDLFSGFGEIFDGVKYLWGRSRSALPNQT